MDPEALVLATQAVAALQAMATPSPAWTEVIGAVGGVVIGVIQCGLILFGLLRIREAAEDRQRQHEETMQQMKNQHEQTMKALDNQRMNTTSSNQDIGAQAAEIARLYRTREEPEH